MDHWVYADSQQREWLRVLLTLQDIDASQWAAGEGTTGYWVAVGFGQSVMTGTDIVMCQYLHSNMSSQTIVSNRVNCIDSKALSKSRPVADAVN